MHKLSVEAPPKILVERYLIEIAKNYNVPYEPDAVVHVGFRIPSLKDEVMVLFCFFILPTHCLLPPPYSLRCVPERRLT